MTSGETWNQSLEKLLLDMKENNIDKRIIIADNLVDSNCANTKRLLELIENQPELYIIGSLNPFTQTEEDISYFDQLLVDKKIIALKIFPGHEAIFADDEKYQSSIDLCLRHSVPLVIHTGMNTNDLECAQYNDPKLIAKIAEKYPELNIIIAHYFWPELEYCFEQTKNFKNIYYDLSAMADQEVLDESGGWNEMKEIIERTLATKPKSFLFGTDYPMCETKKHIELIESLNISETEKDSIYQNKIFNL
jgi:hypothetical protein